VNISDIAAMGGMPRYAILSVGLPQTIDVKFLSELTGMTKAIHSNQDMLLGVMLKKNNLTKTKNITYTLSVIQIS